MHEQGVGTGEREIPVKDRTLGRTQGGAHVERPAEEHQGRLIESDPIVNDNGKWRDSPRQAFSIPKGAQSFVTNERLLGVVVAPHVEFYEGPRTTGQAWEARGHLSIANGLPDRATIVSGLYSTKKELVSLGNQHVRIWDKGGEEPLLDYEQPLPPRIKCTFGFGSTRLAVVTDSAVHILSIGRANGATPEGRPILRHVPAMDFRLPDSVEEVTVFQYEILGIKTGAVTKFYKFDAKSRSWTPDSIDDLVLPDAVSPSAASRTRSEKDATGKAASGPALKPSVR
jgi:hypothetical protein